tara:strand:- start:53 stop:775 length:723 start_codon:yes stop_codon:yes gene_type:complete
VTTALIDSDIVAYRIAFACQNENQKIAKLRIDSYLNDIIACGVDNTYPDCFVDRWQLFLTGKKNFRYDIATTVVYKGNRVAPKPEHLPALREHMMKEWGASVSDGQEADDDVATAGTTLGNDCIMVSLDKDIDQVAGWHYNFVKKIGYYVSESEGLFKLYCQILTGDTADNIVGIRGVGPAKANKILDESLDEYDMYCRCVEAYEGNEDRVIENARLLYLRRTKDEPLWTPPTKAQSQTM